MPAPIFANLPARMAMSASCTAWPCGRTTRAFLITRSHCLRSAMLSSSVELGAFDDRRPFPDVALDEVHELGRAERGNRHASLAQAPAHLGRLQRAQRLLLELLLD